MHYSKTALWRARLPFAFASHKIVAHVLRRLRDRFKDFGHPKPPLTDHLSRDIGLTPTELEHLKLRLPSQDTHHPYG